MFDEKSKPYVPQPWIAFDSDAVFSRIRSFSARQRHVSPWSSNTIARFHSDEGSYLNTELETMLYFPDDPKAFQHLEKHKGKMRQITAYSSVELLTYLPLFPIFEITFIIQTQITTHPPCT